MTHYRAAARMEQHFRPSLTDSGYDVVTENNYFVERRRRRMGGVVVLGERIEMGSGSPAVSAAAGGEGAVAAARAAARAGLSLHASPAPSASDELRLLPRPLRAGRATDEALYRGTVWIDRRTFARVRVQAVQTRTSAPVVSNEEIHTYDRSRRSSGFPVLLLTQPHRAADRADRRAQPAAREGRDVHRLPRQRRGLRASVAAPRASGDRIMYRETDRGLRYYVKEGEQPGGERARDVARQGHGDGRARRSVVRVSRCRFSGSTILDFEFRGRPDTQLALLFAGVLAAGNIQRSEARRHAARRQRRFLRHRGAGERSALRGRRRARSRAAADLAALDRVSTSAGNTRRSRRRSVQYQFRFDAFVRDRTTSETFVVPTAR